MYHRSDVAWRAKRAQIQPTLYVDDLPDYAAGVPRALMYMLGSAYIVVFAACWFSG